MSLRAKLFALLLITSILLLLHITVQAETINEFEFEYYIEWDEQIVLTKYCGSKSEVTVPAAIDGYIVRSTEGTFENNETIEKVIFSNGITSIGPRTFSNCSNLKEVYISDSVEMLGDYAFSGTALSSLMLPKNTSYIGAGCFYNCESLKFVKAEAESLWISQLAFFHSGLEIMELSETPHYYDNSFSQVCNFSYNPVVTFAMRHEPLYTIFHCFVQQPIFIRALLIVLLVIALIVSACLVFAVIRRIRIMLGKDKLKIYSDYNRKCRNSVELQDDSPIFIYDKPHFKKDKIKKVLLSTLLPILYIVGWVEMSLSLMFLMNGKFEFSPALIFVRLIILICGLFIYVVMSYLIIKIYFKISSRIYEKLLEQSHPIRTRIRKVRKVK